MVSELSNLRASLENDEVIPYFQPLIELRTGKLTGFEVLARWQHPERGLVLPDSFIPLAEENGLITSVSQQIFSKAFRFASVLPSSMSLALNISPVEMHSLHLPVQIRDLAQAAHFPLNRITIEITESALFHNLDVAKEIAREIKALGCRLSIDDFGTGYSNLAHLQALEFDDLKIDRSFIAAMTAKRASRKIVAAVIGLSHTLGMTAVAEGVETEEQSDMLCCLGCQSGQGWLFGRPVPPDQLPELVSAESRTAPFVLASPVAEWAASSLEAQPIQRLAQLEAIYVGAPVGLCFLDRDFCYMSLNRKLAGLNGSSVSAHLGKNVKEMIPSLFPKYEPYLLRALAGESLKNIEVEGPSITPGQPDMVCLTSYEPAFDEADEVIGISLVVVDISEHKRTQQALQESDNERRHRVEQTHHVPWIMDAEGNSMQVSSQWAEERALYKGTAHNFSSLESVHVDDIDAAMSMIQEALISGLPIDVQYRVSIGGEWRWIRSQGVPHLNPSGEIVRWYGTVTEMDQTQSREQLPLYPLVVAA